MYGVIRKSCPKSIHCAALRLWFISAAVASVKFPLCCSCSGATFGLFSPCPSEDLFAYKDYKLSILQNNIKLSMKIKLLSQGLEEFRVNK